MGLLGIHFETEQKHNLGYMHILLGSVWSNDISDFVAIKNYFSADKCMYGDMIQVSWYKSPAWRISIVITTLGTQPNSILHASSRMVINHYGKRPENPVLDLT